MSPSQSTTSPVIWGLHTVRGSIDHGRTLFDFLVEVRGNDRGTSMDFRGCCHGLRWKFAGSTARATSHGDSTANVTVAATARAAVLSVAIATAISADAKPQQFPRPSATIATAILRHMAIATEIRGNCHGNFRGRQTTAISSTIHGNLRYKAIATEVRGHPRQLNCHVNGRQFPYNHGSCNGNPRSFPRQSAG